MNPRARLAFIGVLLGSAMVIETSPTLAQFDHPRQDFGSPHGSKSTDRSSRDDKGHRGTSAGGTTQHGGTAGSHGGQGGQGQGPVLIPHRQGTQGAGHAPSGRDHRENRQIGGSVFGQRPDNWNRRPSHFDRRDYNRNIYSQHRFRWHPYRRPHGWYYHRWVFGERLPFFFWTHDYWLTQWWMFGLPVPPIGCEWVRVGDDALLVDTRTGVILEVRYNVFW